MNRLHRSVYLKAAFVFAAVLLAASGSIDAQTPAPGHASGGASGGTILRLSDGTANPADNEWSMWRYFEVWQTDVARQPDGTLVRVDPFKARQKNAKGDYDLVLAKKVTGSEWPTDNWRTPEFDDSSWMKRFGDLRTQYRSLAMMCLRGKFEVRNLNSAADLSLSLTFQGGVVVYLNGQEVGRANLPTGPIANDTLAEDYPKECFLDKDGNLYNGQTTAATDAEVDRRSKGWHVTLTDEDVKHLKERTRRCQITLPRKFLRSGVNVLAIEAHRAPAVPQMFTFRETREKSLDTIFCLVRSSLWWNRVAIDEAKLSAPPTPDWLTPNCARPANLQVFTEPSTMDVNLMNYADPCEPITPLRLSGARNGHYAGEVIISSTKPIEGLRVAVSDLALKGGGAAIPAAGVTVRVAQFTGEGWRGERQDRWAWFDPLLAPTPGAIYKVTEAWSAVPIWITVNVPPDAAPGEYAGQVTVEAKGLAKAVEAPLSIKVSAFKLPEPTGFTTYFSSVESPDSLALQYHVAPWSEEHWKLIDRSFELLAQLGVKDLYIPIVRHTHFGNDYGMVRWIKGADGKYTYDLSIMERYLDTAVKHLGKIPTVCFHLLETTAEHNAKGLAITEYDPKTKALNNDNFGPAWGTPESVAFLKPLLAQLRQSLAKRGLENSMCIGFHAAGGAGPEAAPKAVNDVKAAWPEVRFLRLSHMWRGEFEYKPGHPQWASVAVVAGTIGVFWDPDEEKPIYGWRNPNLYLIYPRTTNSDYAGSNLEQHSYRPEHRFAAEGSILSGRRQGGTWTPRGNLLAMFTPERFQGMRGFGPLGADFWPVLKGAREAKTLFGRFGESYAEGGWGTISLNVVVQSILAPGPDGPAPTLRSEMLREGLQEAEARIYVQNAILDDAPRAKLGAALAEKVKRVCDDRTQGLRYLSEFWTNEPVQNRQPAPDMFVPGVWEARSAALYDLAGEVAKALGQK